LPSPAIQSRNRNVDAIDGGSFDVLVVGGGINGGVSAAALSARGVSVALIDRADFASVTSQEQPGRRHSKHQPDRP
jgi:glycerol-3-phosphate dehydrogenase